MRNIIKMFENIWKVKKGFQNFRRPITGIKFN